MEPRVNVRESCPAGRDLLPKLSLLHRCPCVLRNGIGPVRFSLVFAAALLLAPAGGQRAFAQQPMQWPQDDSFSGAPVPDQSGYGQPQYGQPQGYPQQGYQNSDQQGYGQQPINAQELEQIVAPIAIYPDALLAQILAASTYPAQVAAADQWLRSMGNASPEQVAAAAQAQTSWDPSVKALTAFPQVLSMLDRNLQWTTNLGNAYYNQPQDVLQTVQVMRERAQQAGNLQSTPQEAVSYDQGNIQLAPTNSQVVYVPTYNPWSVYGQPVSPYPDYSPIDTVGSVVGSAVQYGLGFAVSAFGGGPFSLLNWGLDWLANAVLFNHQAYSSRSFEVSDWGFPHGGPRAFGQSGDRGGNRFGGRDLGYNNRGSGFPPARPERALGNGAQGGFNRGSGFPLARPERSFGNQQGFNRGSNYPSARDQGMLGNGGQQGFNRGFERYGSAGQVGQQQAYNHMPSPIGRPQPYGGGGQNFAGRQQQFADPGARSGSGSSFNQRPMQSYGGRQGMAYAAPSQNYRGGSGFGQGGFSQPRSSNGYSGSNGGSQHSGGFHLFGGGHNSQNFGGGGHSSGGFLGGSHSSGGFRGHSSGGFFGGHSGGSHSSGGGHSGGGHSGGGHSGGHGHSH